MTAQAYNRIPDGTAVRFFRDAHSTEHYAATVKQSHTLRNGGHHYEIDCPNFPFIVGFAHDEELFTDLAEVEALSAAAKSKVKELKRINLLSERARIDSEIAALG